LHSGELIGVISTSALELGIDIGDLDLCLLVGYPGSVMSTWQRGGRVGRGRQPSATILIGGEDALDQYYMRNPEEFFRTSPEAAVLNPSNEQIMAQHLRCAAAELPLQKDETLLTNRDIVHQLTCLTARGDILQNSAGDMWYGSRKRPQHLISLRGGGRSMSIIDRTSGEIVGEIDNVRGMKECFPGSVYLHRSKTYVIDKFDLELAEIIAHEETPNYFTRPLTDKHTKILSVEDTIQCCSVKVSRGNLRVTERVTGYQKRHNRTQKLIATVPLDLPEQVMETTGLWLEIDESMQKILQQKKLHFMGAIHALEHALIGHLPLLVLCDRNDVGGISCPNHEQVDDSVIFIYDGYPGGVGLTASAFAKITSLLDNTRKTLQQCGCENGCPACVHSPKCGSGNRPIDKQACLELLTLIMKPASSQTAARVDHRQQAPVPLQKMVPVPAKGLDSLPENFVVFDLETKFSAEEVGGWHKAVRMGVSVAVLYDGGSDEYHTYLEDEISAFIAELLRAKLIVGFNNKRFDNLVLSAYTTEDLSRLPTLDLLEEIHNYLGYRISLNGLAEVTLKKQKSGDGLQALRWYKEGKIELIQKYCRKDVEITKELLFYALDNGYLLFRNKAKQEVRLPLSLESRIAALLHRHEH
jgi:DEAD/DEAH box helicase domain-containing protein